MHSRQRKNNQQKREERMLYLLESIAIEAGADVDHKEQCEGCGDFFSRVASHKRGCEGFTNE